MGVIPCTLVPVPGGRVRCATCNSNFSARELVVVAMTRLEGGSDPEYTALQVQVIPPCPEGRVESVELLLGYGPTASPEDLALLDGLRDPVQPTDGTAGPEETLPG